jgi:hypothetical protein
MSFVSFVDSNSEESKMYGILACFNRYTTSVRQYMMLVIHFVVSQRHMLKDGGSIKLQYTKL